MGGAFQLSNGPFIRNGQIVIKAISWRDPGFDQQGSHPVVQVTWDDAKAFCDWLSKKSGKTVVLPTEAQWEYACRAGTKTAYPWGDNPDDGKGWANCADQTLKKELTNTEYPCFGWEDGFVYTSPVANFNANAFGLYDMIGNAKQWCDDKLTLDGHVGVDFRVVRGASWLSCPSECRSAYRRTETRLPGQRRWLPCSDGWRD